ncbi:hypothetical protein ACGF5O_46810 [Streptomyces sp. NPDC048291]|uniref:hypothetical protein n=1 Tax=Streptomyces sp. NPDC048291 TaxID=3365530 RepID=UPI00371032EE
MDLGVWDYVRPGAVKTVQNLYGKFHVMRYQFSAEGILRLPPDPGHLETGM